MPSSWLAIKYKVELTEAERSRLNEVSQRGKASVRTVKRALSLLKADQGLRDREIADVLLVNPATVARARKRYVEEGLEAAINDRPWPGQERKLDGRQEAHLIAFACSAAPEGHTHWTLQLLADQVVELEFADEHLPGARCARYSKKRTQALAEERVVYPAKVSGEFVARMEDVLDLYQPEYNPERPVVCFVETSRQLTGEVRPSIEAAPGRVARYDTEYQRNGTRNLFMICEPKGGLRDMWR